MPVNVKAKLIIKEQLKPDIFKFGVESKEIAEMTGIGLNTIYQYRSEISRMKKMVRYTAEKGHNKNRELCKTCIYRGRDFGVNRCDYIEISKRSRGCAVEDCDKYVKGPRPTKRNDITYSDERPSWER